MPHVYDKKGRRREIAIRISLGASRWLLVRQLLVESLILALSGSVVALLITFWTQGTLMKFLPVTEDISLALSIAADRTVLLATLVISVLTGVIFGILPAPALRRLEASGLIRGAWDRLTKSGGGPARRRYHITTAGQGFLARSEERFPISASLIKR